MPPFHLPMAVHTATTVASQTWDMDTELDLETGIIQKNTTQRRLFDHKDSGLRGRGGVGFPSGLKWSFMNKPGWEKDPRFVHLSVHRSGRN